MPPDFIIERAHARLAGRSAADPADNALATGLGEKAREAGLDAPGDQATRAADKVREVVIRAFHDEVLRDGGAPLQLMEARITRWVESQL